ncbi:MAG: hypothetical protein JNM94_00385 [Phycisphaerae bacterium]|nr:hypothetical protein [Phycisphaerae bacterium]
MRGRRDDDRRVGARRQSDRRSFTLGGDLTDPRAITAKGILLLLCAAVAAAAIILESPSWRMAGLVAILVWATARSYVFLFYVLHQYVDPRLRYDELLGLLRAIRAKRLDE